MAKYNKGAFFDVICSYTSCKYWTGEAEQKLTSFWAPAEFCSWELQQTALLQEQLQAEHTPPSLPKTNQPQEPDHMKQEVISSDAYGTIYFFSDLTGLVRPRVGRWCSRGAWQNGSRGACVRSLFQDSLKWGQLTFLWKPHHTTTAVLNWSPVLAADSMC